MIGDSQAKYQTMRDRLEAFKILLNSIPENQPKNQQAIGSWKEDLERSHLRIQEFFQTEILDCINSTSEEAIPHYVEIDKQLRLLEADIKLLKITRKPETLTRRINQASDRLTLLSTYCDSLLKN